MSSIWGNLADAADPDSSPSVGPGPFAVVASEGRWILTPHLRLVSSEIARCEFEPIRLIVTTPPRHGKTELVSRNTPAWFIGKYPRKRVLLASYEADFAATHGLAARTIYEHFSTRYFPEAKLSRDRIAATNWMTSLNGGMSTAGVGGPLTGKGADLLIIDDPVKNWEEARSDVMRQHAWDWFRSVAYTRLEPGASVVIIMTRWHEDDLVGRILEDPEIGGVWKVIRLPAVVGPNDLPDPLGREEGEALWPDRYPASTPGLVEGQPDPSLEGIRKQVGSYIWNALYQGRPAPEEGTLFSRKDFRYWTPVVDEGVPKPNWYNLGGARLVDSDEELRFCTADLAQTEKTSSDWTVIGCWVLTGKNELILSRVYRDRVEDPTPLLHQANREFHPAFIGIESAGFGLTIIQQARRQGLPVTELKADKDKYARAVVASARVEAHGLFFEQGASINETMEHELLTFPTGRNDDTVDMVSYGCIEATRRAMDWDAAYGIVTCDGCGQKRREDQGGQSDPCPACGHVNLPEAA